METSNEQQTPNYLDLPDEEIMSLSPASQASVTEPPAKTAEELEAERVAAEQAAAAQADADKAAADKLAAEQAAAAVTSGSDKVDDPAAVLAAGDDATNPNPAAKAAEPQAGKDPPAAQPPGADPAAAAAKAAEAGKENTPPEPKPATPEDYKAFYDRLLGQPIKANGKMIQLRSPEEAERLVQMGLNYTKKMQAWQPRMRIVTMLENNGLMDESKLAHLIDLSKGDAGAIQKLLQDSKFDPNGIDADQAASYKPGNHQVSEAELTFNAVLDDLESSETGIELIGEVHKQWDEQSKRAVYQDPTILRTINEQKALGLYARIVGEMDHLRTLGHLQGVPFLQAYKAVGDMLHDQGRLNPNAAPPAAAPVPVETRVATPAPKVTNNDKAAAASPTKSTPASVKQDVNYLDVPDEQFLKEMKGRL